MEERRSVVTMKGNPLTLFGPDLKTGDKAPQFTVLDSELKQVETRSHVRVLGWG